MIRVRALPTVDEIDRLGQRVVLVPGRAVRVSGIAPAVLDLAVDWVALPDLVVALERLLGPDPDDRASALVEAAVAELADHGLLELTHDD